MVNFFTFKLLTDFIFDQKLDIPLASDEQWADYGIEELIIERIDADWLAVWIEHRYAAAKKNYKWLRAEQSSRPRQQNFWKKRTAAAAEWKHLVVGSCAPGPAAGRVFVPFLWPELVGAFFVSCCCWWLWCPVPVPRATMLVLVDTCWCHSS